MASQKKKISVNYLTETLQKNPNFVLIGYEKIPHTIFENLRKELKKTNAQFKVIKNALFQKTTNKLSKSTKIFTELKKKFYPLRENTALISLSKDYSDGLNLFLKLSKKEKNLSFKFGILDQQIYVNEDLNRIAELPGKDQLIANIIGSMKAPTSRLAHALKFNLTKLVYVLSQKSIKSSS